MAAHRKPTAEEIAAAAGRTVPDILAPGLDILFCGINPGLYTAAVGHHFARPGNRFWPALREAGFTDRLLQPHEEEELLPLGYGITNLVGRATASASEIPKEEFVAGARELDAKVRRFAPRWLAVLGIGAYRAGFERRGAHVGPQEESIDGTRIWVLPNPSGLNAHYRLGDLAEVFRDLRRTVEAGA